MKILLIALIIIVIVAFLFTLWIASYVMSGGKRQTIEDAIVWQSRRYDMSFYNEVEKNDYMVEGANGYLLHVQFLKNPESTNKLINKFIS